MKFTCVDRFAFLLYGDRRLFILDCQRLTVLQCVESPTNILAFSVCSKTLLLTLINGGSDENAECLFYGFNQSSNGWALLESASLPVQGTVVSMVSRSTTGKDAAVYIGIQFLQRQYAVYKFIDHKLDPVSIVESEPATVMIISNDAELVASYVEKHVYIKPFIQNNEKYSCVVLKHPDLVFDISWRPFATGNNSLLTCCADGVYRIWKQKVLKKDEVEFYLQTIIDPCEWVSNYPVNVDVQNSVCLQWMNINSLQSVFDNVPIYALDRADKQRISYEELLEFQNEILFLLRKDDEGSLYCVFWGLKDSVLAKKTIFYQPTLCAICFSSDAIVAEHVGSFKNLVFSCQASVVETARAPHLFPLTEQRYIAYDNLKSNLKVFATNPVCFQPSNTDQPQFRHMYSFSPASTDITQLYKSLTSGFLLSRHENGVLKLWSYSNSDFSLLCSFEKYTSAFWLGDKPCLMNDETITVLDPLDGRVVFHYNKDFKLGIFCLFKNSLYALRTSSNGDSRLLEMQVTDDWKFIVTNEYPLLIGSTVIDIAVNDAFLLIATEDCVEISKFHGKELVTVKTEKIFADKRRKVFTISHLFFIAFENGLEIISKDFRQSISFNESVVDVCGIEIAGSCFLAVAHPHKISIYTQKVQGLDSVLRFTEICEINVETPIKVIEWMEDGKLTIVTTNGFQVIDDFHKAMLEKSSLFPSPFKLLGISCILPDYHPFNMYHIWLWGNYEQVSQIFNHVYRCFRCVEEHDFDVSCISSLSLSDIVENPTKTARKDNTHDAFAIFDLTGGSFSTTDNKLPKQDDDGFSSIKCDYLNDKFTQVRLPSLSNHEQLLLLSLMNSVNALEPKRSGLDDNSLRFLLHVKMNSYLTKTNQLKISAREFIWAYLSDTQEPMIKTLLDFTGNKIYWNDVSKFGIPMWLKNDNEFRNLVEAAARNEFMYNDSRDPVRCGILYLAMKKKRIWEGLWKTAHSHPDQAIMKKFLSNDFTTEKWKLAAVKNAFALLGRQRFDMACCFFLLAEQVDDALSVCVKQLNDLPLAFAVARLFYQDDESLLLTAVDKLFKHFDDDSWSEILVSLVKKDYPSALRLSAENNNEPLMTLCHTSIESKLKNMGRPIEAVSEESLWNNIAYKYLELGAPLISFNLVQSRNINEEGLNLHIINKFCVRQIFSKRFYFTYSEKILQFSYLSNQKEAIENDFKTMSRTLNVDTSTIRSLAYKAASKFNLIEVILDMDIQDAGHLLCAESNLIGQKLGKITKETGTLFHKYFRHHYLPMLMEYFIQKKFLEEIEIALLYSAIAQFCFICIKSKDLQRLHLIFDSTSLIKKISLKQYVEDVSAFIGYLINGSDIKIHENGVDGFEREHHRQEALFVSKLFKIGMLEGLLDILLETILLCLKHHNLENDFMYNNLYPLVSSEMYQLCEEWDKLFKADPPPKYKDDHSKLLGTHEERRLWNILLHNDIFILPETEHRLKTLKDGLSRPDSELALHGAASQGQIHKARLSKMMHKLQNTRSKSTASLSIAFQL